MTEMVSVAPYQYFPAPASASALVLGANGATGDYLSHILIVPETTSPGAVTVVDGSSANIVFTGGASSVTSLAPFIAVLGAASRNSMFTPSQSVGSPDDTQRSSTSASRS